MSGFDHTVYWEERLASTDGLQGVGYLGLGQAFNEWMYKVRRSVFRRVVRRYLPDLSGASVLDIGSGTGEYLDLWLKCGARTVNGSDLTQTAVERLGQRYPGLRISQADISEPGIDLGRHQAVSCMDVLFHVVDPVRFDQAIRNLRNCLEPGGYLLLSDHFLRKPRSGQVHFTTRTLEEYTTVLQKHGLRIVARRPMFHLMNLPADARSRWLHRWWGTVIRVCERSPAAGGVLGMLLYPLELLIVGLRREGVSAEIMVCKAA